MRPSQFACLLTLLLGGGTPAGAAASLAYLDLGASGSACCLVPDGHGNLYVVGNSATISGATSISVTRFDAANHPAAMFTFGGGAADLAKSAALDPQGNLVIAGQT